MIFKIIILILLAVVVISLASALYHLISNKGDSDKLVRSLTWRIGLSIFIFVLLFIGQATGLITPHGL